MIDMAVFGKVAVLFGGTSAEREISLKSGSAVLKSLQGAGVEAYAFDYTGPESLQELITSGFDRIFNVIHGRGGEDGQIQGALQLAGVPVTGSSVMASALAMDKYRTKLLWNGLGLPTPPFHLLRSKSDIEEVAALGFPIAIKPVNEGSSIGISKVSAIDDLESARQQASEFDSDVIAEKWILGREYTCAIVNGNTLPLILVSTSRDFYDYKAKYLTGDSRFEIPSGLSDSQEEEIYMLCLDAFDAIGGSGWGRVDLMRDDEGKNWLLEVNTVPGMTDHSLVPMAGRAAGMSVSELVVEILKDTIGDTD